MPVADDREDKHQDCDDQQAYGFLGVCVVSTAWLLFAGGHGIIVAPRMLNYAAIRYVVASHQPFRANRSIRHI